MKRAWTILLGIALGLGLGVMYAWVIRPAPLAVAPAGLRAEAQAQYIQWIAWAYAGEGDVERARVRLAALDEADPVGRVSALAQHMAAEGAEASAVQRLRELVIALEPDVLTATPTATPTRTATPTATPPPTITPIPLPTRPPTPTPIGALLLTSQQVVCEPRPAMPLIQVLALDALGKPIPGVEVLVEWNGGFDRFFTGLKPEQGTGYGDFAMLPGVTYTVRLALDPSAAVADVTIPECADVTTGQTFGGAWLLTFRGQ